MFMLVRFNYNNGKKRTTATTGADKQVGRPWQVEAVLRPDGCHVVVAHIFSRSNNNNNIEKVSLLSSHNGDGRSSSSWWSVERTDGN